MPYYQLYYHFIWATHNREPLITALIEEPMYGYIIGKVDYVQCFFHAIGGIENHIHLVVLIPPTIAVAQFIKTIKGSSSHFINEKLAPTSAFGWQHGYSAFTVDHTHLKTIVNYVRNQKIHHQQGTTITDLEHHWNDQH